MYCIRTANVGSGPHPSLSLANNTRHLTDTGHKIDTHRLKVSSHHNVK